MNADTNFNVRLIAVSSLIGGSRDLEQVIFNVTPRFSESRDVEYTPVSPVHMPGSMQVYKNTKSRSFSIGAHFISRTIDEATLNMLYLQTLRGWTMPYFGSTTTLNDSNKNARVAGRDSQEKANGMSDLPAAEEQQLSADVQNKNAIARQKKAGLGVELLGAPPDVLYLYAYSAGSPLGGKNRSNTYGTNINKVPVVITNLSISYPDDVDYIPTRSHVDPRQSEPFPIKMDVEITLVETHSPREYEQFDLLKYKRGTLNSF